MTAGPAERALPDQTELREYLSGVAYPADRASLLAHARRHGASAEVLRHLEALPNRAYYGRHAVSVAYAET